MDKASDFLLASNSAPAHFINENIREAVEELENLKLIPDDLIREKGELRLYPADECNDRVIEFVWKGKIAITFTGKTNFQLGTLELSAQHHYDEERVAVYGKDEFDEEN